MERTFPALQEYLKSFILFCLIFFIINSRAYSQNDILYNNNFESSGSILNIYSNNFNSERYLSDYIEINSSQYQGSLDFSMWKFSKKILAGAYLNSTAEYHYRNQIFDNESYYNKNLSIRGEVFTGLGYYPFKNKFYTSLAFSSSFYASRNENSNSNNIITGLSNSGSYSTNYFFPAIGYGRIVNMERSLAESNFEDVLLKENYIRSPLPPEIRKQLTELLEERNDKDFISRYRDNDEVEFFTQVEALLLKEKIIDRSLNAKTTMMLYQTLSNPKFVYYPEFEGYQIQAEVQLHANVDSDQNFITLGGIYGKLLNENSQLLFSGFMSFPFNTRADIFGLFNFTKNPFNSYLPVLFQRYELQNNNYLDPRRYSLNYYSGNQNYLLGGKVIFFKSFSRFIGIRPYTEVIVNKQIGAKENIISSTGAGIDYNIFSRLLFNLSAEANITNKYKPQYYYTVGFFLNVF